MQKLRVTFYALSIVLTLLNSGCVGKKVFIVADDADYFEIPMGTELYVQDLTAADGEPVMKKIKTMKQGAFYSVDAQVDVLEARKR